MAANKRYKSELDMVIVGYLAAGKTPKEISPMVSLSWRTVEKRISRMRQLMGCKNVTHLVAMVIGEKVIQEKKIM